MVFLMYQTTRDSQRETIEDYYTIIENQDGTAGGSVRITQRDIERISLCRKKTLTDLQGAETCLRYFYRDYTFENGTENAFIHLGKVLTRYHDLFPPCHYAVHGIGEASFYLHGQDVSRAFSIPDTEHLFKNMASCGNGYYHGFMWEMAKDEDDKDALVRMFRPICGDGVNKKWGVCLHGIGHVALAQMSYRVMDMIYICDGVSSSTESRFSCYTGGFMEYAETFPNSIKMDGGAPHFVLCDSLDPAYQAACYLEHSDLFEALYKKNKNYTEHIGSCKKINNELNRMACVKLFAIRATRIDHHSDIYGMCRNTLSLEERVMCTAVAAKRISISIDETLRGKISRDAIDDVCGTLGSVYGKYCSDIVRKYPKNLFFTSEWDLLILREFKRDSLEKWIHGRFYLPLKTLPLQPKLNTLIFSAP